VLGALGVVAASTLSTPTRTIQERLLRVPIARTIVQANFTLQMLQAATLAHAAGQEPSELLSTMLLLRNWTWIAPGAFVAALACTEQSIPDAYSGSPAILPWVRAWLLTPSAADPSTYPSIIAQIKKERALALRQVAAIALPATIVIAAATGTLCWIALR